MRENPEGLSKGEYRAVRGGSWGDGAAACRVANRGDDGATITNCILGFRVAFSVPARKSRDERKS